MDATAEGATIAVSAGLSDGACFWVPEPWFHSPNGEVLERLEWLTDVLPSFGGEEQRRALRKSPRRSFEFAVMLTHAERRTAENRLHKWQSRVWSVPVWMDSSPLGVDLSPGASVISIDTATRDFHVGGLVGICTAAADFEIAMVESMTDSQITLSAPLVRAWPEFAEVFPVKRCRMLDRISFSRFTGDVANGTIRFECSEPNDWPALSESTYRGLPVFAAPSDWSEDPSFGCERDRDVVDGATGLVYTDDKAAGPVLLQSHRWFLHGRSEIDAFRKWLYARRGRLSAFWLPTASLDFMLVANIGSAAVTIDVEHCGYTKAIAQGINRRDIRIELASGAVFHRRITASTEISATIERLTIDSALGSAVAVSEVRSISYMMLARLDADAVEIAWSAWDLAESSAITRSSMNDL